MDTFNLHLTPLEHQYMKAYTRYQLGLRKSRPMGSNEGPLTTERRVEIERSVDHMLRKQ